MIHIVPWNVLIFAIVWWSGTCYIFVPPKSSILDHRRNSLLYVERSVGQVYQFTGHGAPPEFAKLFRANKISGRVKSKPAGIKRAPAAKVAPIPDLEPFEDLELEVARKYGGNKKRIDGSSSNVRTSNAVRGFEPQQKSDRASQVSSRTPTSREELIRKWEGKGGSAQKVTRSTVTTEGRTSKQAAQVADATRDQPSAQGFRLRPPPPMDPEQLARTKAKEAVAAEKAKLLEQKIKLMREKNKELFKPFHFKDHNNNIANVDQPEQLDSERDDDAATSFEDTESPLFSSTGFEALGISDPGVLRNLEKMQVAMPTQIQALAIPALIRAEQNVILQAQTGSGKTLAYLLPLLSSVDVSIKQVQVLILAPSRELVQQIGQVASALFAGTPYKTVTLIGGANVQNQLKHLREDRPQIVVATPGRLAEIVFELEKLRLSGVHTVVIDEVDQMLREPYIGEVETLLQATPFVLRKQDVTTPLGGQLGEEAALEEQENSSEELVAQADDSSSSSGSIIMDSSIGGRPSNRHLLCLVSATSHDPAVTAFADRYCTHSDSGITTSRNSEITTTSTSSDSNESVEAIKPLRKKCLKIAASGGAMLPRSITHGLISTPRMRSLEFLKRFLNARPSVQHALIFVNDPRRVEGVVKELGMAGIVAAPLHGETSKDDRKEILMRLKDGRLKLVVATEMAARGLDIPQLTHVINYELPTDAEHYVHRTGRCGRAGREGLVMNFANPDTKFVVRRFGKKLGIKVLDCEIRDNKVFLKRT